MRAIERSVVRAPDEVAEKRSHAAAGGGDVNGIGVPAMTNTVPSPSEAKRLGSTDGCSNLACPVRCRDLHAVLAAA